MIAVLDFFPKDNIYEGRNLRIINVFSRLKKKGMKFIYIPVLVKGSVVPGYMYHIFDHIDPIEINEHFHALIDCRFRAFRRILPAYFYPLTAPRLMDQMKASLDFIVEKHKISVVHTFCYTSGSILLSLKRRSKIVWDIGDSFWLTALRQPLIKKLKVQNIMLKNYEHHLIHRLDRTVLVGKAEYDLYPKKFKRNLVWIPNGVDDSFLQYGRGRNIQQRSIIFTGNMAFGPNIDAVRHFYMDIWPGLIKKVPDVKWFLVGMNPEPIKEFLPDDQRIVITGRVDDIKPYLANANIYIAPIRLGGGIKNKLLEALAMGKEIVAYDRAVDGFGDGHAIHLVKNAKDFKEKLKDLLGLGETFCNRKNQKFVEDFYTWDRAVKQYQILYDGLDK